MLRYIEAQSLRFVQDHLSECRQSSGDRGDLRNMLTSHLDLGQAETDALSYTERTIAWASPGGFDDSIGFALWTLSGPALTARNIDFNLDSVSERWSLSATLQLSTTVTFCQAERGAAARALAVVKSLQTRRAVLLQACLASVGGTHPPLHPRAIG